MKLLLILVTVGSISAYSLCPFRSSKLDLLVKKAKELQSFTKSSQQCQGKIDIDAHVKSISSSSQKIHGIVTKSLTDKTNPTLDINALKDVPIQDAMAAVQSLSSIITQKNLNDECSGIYHSKPFWSSLMTLFNEMSPYITSINPTFSAYAQGIKAVGSIANHLLSAEMQRKERFNMNNAQNREVFINSSCMLHELAATTYNIGSVQNHSLDYLNQEKEKVQKESISKFENLSENVVFKNLLSKDIKDLLKSIKPLMPNNLHSANDWETQGQGQPGIGSLRTNRRTGGGIGTLEENAQNCSIIKKYLKNSKAGYSRSERLKNYLLYFSRKFQNQEDEIKSLKFSLHQESLDRFFTDSICSSNIIKPMIKDLQEEISDTEIADEIEISKTYPKFAKALKAQAEELLKINLIEKRLSLQESLRDESTDYDLAEVYLIEKAVSNSLFFGKRFAYYWILFNAERSQQFLDSFKKKLRRQEHRNLSGVSKCRSIQATKKDFIVANSLYTRSVNYCKTMEFLTSKSEHLAYSRICDMKEKDSLFKFPSMMSNSYYSHSNSRQESYITTELKVDIEDYAKKANLLDQEYENNNCHQIDLLDFEI